MCDDMRSLGWAGFGSPFAAKRGLSPKAPNIINTNLSIEGVKEINSPPARNANAVTGVVAPE